MKKVIFKLDLHDDKDKQKAMKAVSSLSGIDSISMDMKERKLTVVGDVDPVTVVRKLRKLWHTDIVSVGPAKEPEKKKEEPKKEEPKKEDDKKKEDKDKQKAMKAVSSLSGIDSISMDRKERKLTVVGDVDPVTVVSKLRKLWHTDIVSVGPAKEPEKKEEPKKEEPKKEDDKKKEDEKKKDPNAQIAELVKAYKAYNPHMTTHYYVQSAEENPNACVKC